MRGDVHVFGAPKGRRGHEQDGARFAVILQSDDLPLSTVIVAPTSISCASATFRPEVTVAERRTRVMVDQLSAVDWSRLGDPVGHLSHDDMGAVERAAEHVLSMRP